VSRAPEPGPKVFQRFHQCAVTDGLWVNGKELQLLQLCSLFFVQRRAQHHEVSVAQAAWLRMAWPSEDHPTGHLEIRIANSNGWFLLEAVMSISNAWSPRTASSGHSFQRRSKCTRRWRLVSLSSTISTAGLGPPPPVRRTGSRLRVVRKREANQKVDPWPTTLSTPMLPPSALSVVLEIASPRPVPPNFRVAELSTWLNDWRVVRKLRASCRCLYPLLRYAMRRWWRRWKEGDVDEDFTFLGELLRRYPRG